jgi:hypothetical protein
MRRERIKEQPIYREQRLCKRPSTEQTLRLFSLAERHTLLSGEKPIQSFPSQFTDKPLICSAFPSASTWPDSGAEIHALSSPGPAECKLRVREGSETIESTRSSVIQCSVSPIEFKNRESIKFVVVFGELCERLCEPRRHCDGIYFLKPIVHL